jgi:hypothetical protein
MKNPESWLSEKLSQLAKARRNTSQRRKYQ